MFDVKGRLFKHDFYANSPLFIELDDDQDLIDGARSLALSYILKDLVGKRVKMTIEEL